MATLLVIGERMNLPRRLRYDALPVSRWVDVSLRLGAFNKDVRLRDLLGREWDASMNLLPPARQGDYWDAGKARLVAHLAPVADFDRVVLCGRRVASAFGFSRWSMLHSVERFMLVPHPSGMNRLWNDEFYVQAAKDMVKEFLA